MLRRWVYNGYSEKLNYGNNENVTQVFPVPQNHVVKRVRLVFSQFNLENNFDFLRVYDDSNSGTPIYNLTGTNPGTIEFNIVGSAWKTIFTSDYSVTSTGYSFEFYYYTDLPEIPGVSANSPGEEWIDMSLQNNWQFYGLPFNYPSYKVDTDGRVHLRGLIRSGSGVISRLSRVAPERTELFSVHTGGGTGRIDISNNGNIAFIAGNNTYVQLDGLSFTNKMSIT